MLNIILIAVEGPSKSQQTSHTSTCGSTIEMQQNRKFTSNIRDYTNRVEIPRENNKKEMKAKCKICNKFFGGAS